MFTNSKWSLTFFVGIGFILTGLQLVEGEWYDWDPDENECPGALARRLPVLDIELGEPWRSIKTLPPGLVIENSTIIPGAGLGVISQSFIPRYTWLAEYQGEIVLEKGYISDYAWTIWRGGEKYFYVDAYDDASSNWIKFINCSRRKSEENVIMLQCYDKPYYVTQRDIYPGEELLVYYGDNYANDLRIDTDNYLTS